MLRLSVTDKLWDFFFMFYFILGLFPLLKWKKCAFFLKLSHNLELIVS